MEAQLQSLLDDYESLMPDGSDMRIRLTGTFQVGYCAPAASPFMPAVLEELVSVNDDARVTFFQCYNQSAQDGLVSGA